jgi:hypothetical protein
MVRQAWHAALKLAPDNQEVKISWKVTWR